MKTKNELILEKLEAETESIMRRVRNRKPRASQRYITGSEHITRQDEGKLRNKPCHCGSGIKLKKCCLNKSEGDNV